MNKIIQQVFQEVPYISLAGLLSYLCASLLINNAALDIKLHTSYGFAWYQKIFLAFFSSFLFFIYAPRSLRSNFQFRFINLTMCASGLVSIILLPSLIKIFLVLGENIFTSYPPLSALKLKELETSANSDASMIFIAGLFSLMQIVILIIFTFCIYKWIKFGTKNKTV